MKLWEICKEIEAIFDNMNDDGLYIHPETGELLTFEEALDSLHMERREKLEKIAMAAENRAIEARALGEKIDSLTKRKRAAEADIARMKACLMAALVREDGTAEKFSTENVVISIRKNKPSVIISDEALLPMEFKIQRIEVKPDKESIREVLSRGIEVPGAKLERGRSVTIK